MKERMSEEESDELPEEEEEDDDDDAVDTIDACILISCLGTHLCILLDPIHAMRSNSHTRIAVANPVQYRIRVADRLRFPAKLAVMSHLIQGVAGG